MKIFKYEKKRHQYLYSFLNDKEKIFQTNYPIGKYKPYRSKNPINSDYINIFEEKLSKTDKSKSYISSFIFNRMNNTFYTYEPNDKSVLNNKLGLILIRMFKENERLRST